MGWKWALPVLFLFIAANVHAGEFAIHDGDTVVFLGDSITAEGTYSRVVENYTLLRYPHYKLHFVNAGWGGDTAAGGLARLQRDVFDKGATVLTVAYGINDIGWGGKADDEHRKKYLDSIRGIVEACKQKGVRVFICSAAVTGSDPDKSETDYLQKMCDDGMEISRSLGEGAIDIQREMRAIQKRIKQANAGEKDEKKKETLHAGDGIHLNDLGETAMGFAIIKGLGAPRDVSVATINAADQSIGVCAGCKITNVKAAAGILEFDRLDEGLPYNAGLFAGLKFRFIPIPEDINRYMLTVTDLKPGKYELKVDGRSVGTFTADQFRKGLNLSSSTANGWEPGGPWDAQAWSLTPLTEARFKPFTSGRMAKTYNATNPNLPAIQKNVDDINSQIEDAQRRVVQPTTYHFVLKPVAEKK